MSPQARDATIQHFSESCAWIYNRVYKLFFF